MRAQPKCDVKWGPQSLMTFLGSPNHRNMWLRYSFAIWGPVMVVVQGRNMALWEQPWSTMVSIASWPLLLGSPVIKSIGTCKKGLAFSGDVIWNIRVLRQCVRFLFCWQVVHPLIYLSTHNCAPGQK